MQIILQQCRPTCTGCYLVLPAYNIYRKCATHKRYSNHNVLVSGVPGIPRQGRQATWTSKGGCVQWRIQDLHPKKGRAEKSLGRSAPRASYGWGPGAEPLPGAQGRSPRKLSSFQQIGGGGTICTSFSCIIFYHSWRPSYYLLKTRELPGDPPPGSH